MIIIVPIALLTTAKQVSRSLDPDRGGYEAFATYISATDTPTYAIYQTPARAEFIQQLSALTASPAILKSAIDADIAQRWVGADAPTLDDCAAFLSGIQLFIDRSYEDVLTETGLSVVSNVDIV